MKNLIKQLLRENLQLADKVYFNTGKLSLEDKKEILSITNGDPYTKIISDFFFNKTQDNKTLVGLYNQLKTYNKNVFPIYGFNINGVHDTPDLIKALIEREKILNIFNHWPSIAKRNMKADIRVERDSKEMEEYRHNLEYADSDISLLNNRNEKAKNTILMKMFPNNTTLDDVLDFIEEKGNLLGGTDLTKKQIGQILKKDSQEYDELKVKYNKGNIMIIEVTGPEGIKLIGCNSVWCFTYNRKGDTNWNDWNNNSTNGYCYIIINFNEPSNSETFMHVLTKPLMYDYSDVGESGSNRLYNMANRDVGDDDEDSGFYSVNNYIENLIDLPTAMKVMNFGVKQPREKKKKQKFVDPNQLALDLHENIKRILRENINVECDCCKYFDMESLERFGALENPIYYAINKREINQLVYISPKQYIYNIARGFGLSYEDALGNAYNDEKAGEYANMMKNGSKAPIGYYVDNKADQEGRHRAAAAMKLNCDKIPVVKITKGLDENYVKNLVRNLKDLSREEINNQYLEQGYKGISDLDWRELQNYIKFRLD
jgi:hypothetical protein